jgi:hypothetical protein
MAGPAAELTTERRSYGRSLARAHVTDAGDAAWLLALPLGALSAAAIALLGPPLGRVLYPAHAPYTYWRHLAFALHPEPTEQARYLLSLLVPAALALAIAATIRVRPRLPVRLVAVLVPLSRTVAVGILLACLVAQRRLRYGPIYTDGVGPAFHRAYFTLATLAVAAVIAAVLTIVVSSAPTRRRLASWLGESSRRRRIATVVAVALTAVWMLHAIHSDRSISSAIPVLRDHIEYPLNEAFAVLDGRTPLVNFTSQYSSLWPFLLALSLLAFGKTLLVFTITGAALTAAAMLAIYGVLRRVTGRAVTALLLYLPFLATSFFTVIRAAEGRYTFGTYFGVFPLRYAGPYLLAWLAARRLDGRGRARAWPLFLAAGLVVLNNVEFGLPAFAATLAACAWTLEERRMKLLARLLAQAVLGMALAYAAVCALTLVRAGALPQLGRLVEFARLFARGGFNMLPMPGVLGLHLILYLTAVAAIGAATVRAARRKPGRVLTGMLAWCGVFGLGAGSYYAGRSHPDVLIALFSIWALTLALLTVDCVERIVAGPSRRAGIVAFALFLGMGLATCSLAQTPLPWKELDRVLAKRPPNARISATPFVPDPATRSFFASSAYGSRAFYFKPGAPMAILVTSGHRIADAFGVVNVSPYSGATSAFTAQQLRGVIRVLRRSGGNTLIMPTAGNEDYLVLARAGFRFVTASGLRTYRHEDLPPEAVELSWPRGTVRVPWLYLTATKWVDTRNLRPRFLRRRRGAPVMRIGLPGP